MSDETPDLNEMIRTIDAAVPGLVWKTIEMDGEVLVLPCAPWLADQPDSYFVDAIRRAELESENGDGRDDS